jgi:CubicO group peptidase (beta-lactamase class C family)
MNRIRSLCIVSVAAWFFRCASTPPTPQSGTSVLGQSIDGGPAPSQQRMDEPPAQLLETDTLQTTDNGATYLAPAGWSVLRRGPMTVLSPPERDAQLALVEVQGATADAAVAAAWRLYKPTAAWPLKVTTTSPDKDGWSDIHQYSYQTSPNEKRDVEVQARRSIGGWMVILYDMPQAVGEKRTAAVSMVFGRLYPKGYTRESFAGKKANVLDATRVAELGRWVESAMKALGIPGAAVGLVQNGKVIFADGFGVRELGKPGKPDGDTAFMIASNTKALTTLMLAKLVESKRLQWDTPVSQVLPSFRLGDAEITGQVQVKHLVCACTGLPRQDLEWLFEFKKVTPAGAMATLAGVQPTSKFGEMYQYSNLLAGAGGFVGGHAVFPKLELGAAYDLAMRQLVFAPLGMRRTTFNYAEALKGNHAWPHAPTVDGAPAKAEMEINASIVPLRPAGAAWSTVRDLLSYVSMELAAGRLNDGSTYIAQGPLLERRVSQVPMGADQSYGMGLMVSTKYGTPVVHHGGDMIGFHSDMIWLPEHQVGAVVLTNGDPGWILRNLFQRKLLEVLFDGRPEADSAAAAAGKTFFEELQAERRLLTVPASPREAAKLSRRYLNQALGRIDISTTGSATMFDFGEWRSEVASRENPDGTVSFVTVSPGVSGFVFVVGSGDRPTLTTRDAQHEYVFAAEGTVAK